jgi:hypothetical protein
MIRKWLSIIELNLIVLDPPPPIDLTTMSSSSSHDRFSALVSNAEVSLEAGNHRGRKKKREEKKVTPVFRVTVQSETEDGKFALYFS